VRTEPLTPLSPPPRARDARAFTKPRVGRRGRSVPARVNEADLETTRGAFHRATTFAPQRPLERPAPASSSSAAWPPRGWRPTPLHPGGSLAEFPELGPRPRVPLPTGSTLLWTWATFADFCNRIDARAHPSSRRSSHASGAFAPLLAGTNRCRLRWPPWASPPGGPANRELRAAAFARRAPLAWREQLTGRSSRAKASRALLTSIARALLVEPRAPGSPVRLAVGSGGPRRLVAPA